MLDSMTFKVTCAGKISGSARAKLGEKGIKVAQGGSGPSGRRYTLRPVKAKNAEAAVNKARAAVEEGRRSYAAVQELSLFGHKDGGMTETSH